MAVTLYLSQLLSACANAPPPFVVHSAALMINKNSTVRNKKVSMQENDEVVAYEDLDM